MIYIQETFPDDKSVSIKVDGVLDDASIPILNNVFLLHSKKEKRILIDLKHLINICREGIDYLQQIQTKVEFIDPPPFITLRKNDLNPKDWMQASSRREGVPWKSKKSRKKFL